MNDLHPFQPPGRNACVWTRTPTGGDAGRLIAIQGRRRAQPAPTAWPTRMADPEHDRHVHIGQEVSDSRLTLSQVSGRLDCPKPQCPSILRLWKIARGPTTRSETWTRSVLFSAPPHAEDDRSTAFFSAPRTDRSRDCMLSRRRSHNDACSHNDATLPERPADPTAGSLHGRRGRCEATTSGRPLHGTEVASRPDNRAGLHLTRLPLWRADHRMKGRRIVILPVLHDPMVICFRLCAGHAARTSAVAWPRFTAVGRMPRASTGA